MNTPWFCYWQHIGCWVFIFCAVYHWCMMYLLFIFQGNTKMNLVMLDLIVKVKKRKKIWLQELIQMKSWITCIIVNVFVLITMHRNILAWTLILILHTKEREFWRIQAVYKTILHQIVVVTTGFIMKLAPAVYYILIKWSCKWKYNQSYTIYVCVLFYTTILYNSNKIVPAYDKI